MFDPVEYCELEAAALQWLRYENRCFLVSCQRGVAMLGDPDVFGVNPKRQTIEIEIKMTLADFKADASKRSRRMREGLPYLKPWKFYFLAPVKLSQKIAPLLPAGAGLLTLGNCGRFMVTREIKCIAAAVSNPHARQLVARDLFKAAQHMSATLVKQQGKLYKAMRGNQ